MSTRRIVLGLLTLMLLAFTAPAQQAKDDASTYDVVKLKNGQELVGRVTAEDETTVTVLFRGGEIVLPRRRIAEIVRAERAAVEEKAAIAQAHLGRFEEREEHFFVYYRGKRVGWRQTGLGVTKMGDTAGYLFEARTVYMKDDGTKDMDLRVSEFVDHDLTPERLTVSEVSGGFSSLTQGEVDKGHLLLRVGGDEKFHESEILFADETEFLLPLLRRLADATHYPEKGETYKVYDSLRRRFVRIHAQRTLRKEIVAGKHQFVTVWKLTAGERAWEIWIDGYGGVVREELGGPHMVALRSDTDKVLAYSRGEPVEEDSIDLALKYENVPSGFRLERPNLTWSFEFPEFDSPVAITLLNPTLQASVNVVVLDRIGEETAAETVVLDLLDRIERKSANHEVLFQQPGDVGGVKGVRFESINDRKGTNIRTIGAISVSKDRAYALLAAAPSFRFHEARGQLERILKSFEIIGAKPGSF